MRRVPYHRWDKLREKYLCSQPAQPFWVRVSESLNGRTWTNDIRRLAVIQSLDFEADGHLWMHTSLSREDRAIPGYDEIALVKELFVGPDRLALQLFVPRKEHVNLHPGCLHLWTPLEHRPVPDFRRSLVPGLKQI